MGDEFVGENLSLKLETGKMDDFFFQYVHVMNWLSIPLKSFLTNTFPLETFSWWRDRVGNDDTAHDPIAKGIVVLSNWNNQHGCRSVVPKARSWNVPFQYHWECWWNKSWDDTLVQSVGNKHTEQQRPTITRLLSLKGRDPPYSPSSSSGSEIVIWVWFCSTKHVFRLYPQIGVRNRDRNHVLSFKPQIGVWNRGRGLNLPHESCNYQCFPQ